MALQILNQYLWILLIALLSFFRRPIHPKEYYYSKPIFRSKTEIHINLIKGLFLAASVISGSGTENHRSFNVNICMQDRFPNANFEPVNVKFRFHVSNILLSQ